MPYAMSDILKIIIYFKEKFIFKNRRICPFKKYKLKSICTHVRGVTYLKKDFWGRRKFTWIVPNQQFSPGSLYAFDGIAFAYSVFDVIKKNKDAH